MRLRQVRIYHYRRPFQFTVRTPHKAWNQADSMILALDFDNGVTGWGESAPRSYVTGETPDSVERVFADLAAPVLFDQDIRGREGIPGVVETVAEACGKGGAAPCPSALGAVDIALLDALTRRDGPGPPAAVGETVRDRFPYSLSIPIVPPDMIRAFFHELGLGRFRHIKVLMGPDREENTERTALLRGLFGPRADIRVEANGKWSYAQALDMLSALRPYGVSAVEQPLAPDRLRETARLRRAVGIPVVLDESVSSLEQLTAAHRAGAVDIVNIKISKCGGLYRSQRIAAYAEERDLKCQLGAHMGESPILQWAGRVFGRRTRNLAYFEGCSHLLYETLAGRPREEQTGEARFEADDTPPDPQEVLAHCRPVRTLPRS